MTIRKKQFNKAKSKPHANDYVKNLILDKMDSSLFNIFFVSLQPKRMCNRLHNSSYKFSTATAILGCLKQTTIKNN